MCICGVCVHVCVCVCTYKARTLSPSVPETSPTSLYMLYVDNARSFPSVKSDSPTSPGSPRHIKFVNPREVTVFFHGAASSPPSRPHPP